MRAGASIATPDRSTTFPAPPVPAVIAGLQRPPRHGPVCFDNDIPLFVEQALERLHGSVFSCVVRARVDGWAQKASSYVYLHRGEPCAVLLYCVQGRTLTILSEVFTMGAHHIAVFAEHVLARYRQVSVIRFHSVDTDLALLGMPMLKVRAKEDIVVDLPPDRQAYWSSLGKATRQNIKYYRNKLAREQGEFSLSIQEAADITRSAFDEVIGMNRARMQCKGKVYGNSDDDLEQLWRFTQQAGMVIRVMVKGRVLAGSICLRSADNWHLETIAHDPAMNDYRPGTLCCFLTIEECIRRGGREFHFLWGQYDYKYRFLGKERRLYDLAIYRSRTSMVLQPGPMLRAWSQQVRGRARDWLTHRLG